MGQILLLLLFCVGGGAAYFFVMKKSKQMFGHLNAGDVARRLNMQLVEGDPTFNLGMSSPETVLGNKASIGAGLGFDNVIEFRLRMVGAPYARPSEISLWERQTSKLYGDTRKTDVEYDSRICADTRAPSHFEILPRNPYTGMQVNATMTYPVQTFGHPALDAALVVRSADPGLPARLANVVAPLCVDPATAHLMRYVHVTCQEGKVVAHVDRSLGTMITQHTEKFVHLVNALASTLEGMPIPAMIPPPAPAHAA